MIFRRNNSLAAYAGARAEDRQVLRALLNHGADLAQPRHVLHFIFGLADEPAARALASAGGEWQATAKPPPDGYAGWAVVFERHGYVLTPENVTGDAAHFVRLAAAHGANYDGWEASL